MHPETLSGYSASLISFDEFSDSMLTTAADTLRARDAMNKMRDLMEHEMFYGKPKPHPYAGDASFGVF